MSAALPFATTEHAPIACTIKERPEDFVVEEIPAYEPSGEGEHLYVFFEKTSIDTREAVRRIARVLEAEPKDAGTAGMKDRHAITRQWASFHRGDPARLEGVEIEGVRVLSAARHGNKLRTGHLRGNRFRIRLRGASADSTSTIEATLADLATRGVPNFYGEQRFGRDRDNAARARAWIVDGARAPREHFERKLLVSALQSELFNALCAERVRDGSYGGVIAGDLCRKEDTGGLFVVTELEVDAARAAAFEISATGPMFGASMRWPEADAKAREEATLSAGGLDAAALERFAKWGEGTRRPYRVRLRAPEVVQDDDGVVVSFELPAGSYATVVLREITREA